jgi:squalene-hopene/tetraprenyl-beta-curcumene cyclase
MQTRIQTLKNALLAFVSGVLVVASASAVVSAMTTEGFAEGATAGDAASASKPRSLGDSTVSLENPSKSGTSPRQGTAPTRPELRAAIERGLVFLQKAQNTNGWWSTPDQPAITALVLTAMNLEPTQRFQRSRTSEMNRGFDYILSSARPDGSIHRVGLANYNTSLSLMALISAADTNFLPVILKAREFIAGSQIDMGVKGTNDTPFDGGVGYGSKYQHSDMNNTLAAIEAMRASESLLPKGFPSVVVPAPDSDLKDTPLPDLDWKAVARFLANCQNLPETNGSDRVSNDPKDRGGFFYYPGHSMAGAVTNSATGRVALRSYGSMSYGGLLSYIYAKMDKADPRVVAVKEWLRTNYTIEENPGMGQQGYFYYLHLMTKALTFSGEERLRLSDGTEVPWQAQVAGRLLRLQKADGSWVNPEPRWWEADPVLATCYAVMTLETLDRRMP